MENLKKYLLSINGKDVLDVATGKGEFIYYIKEFSNIRSITAVDIVNDNSNIIKEQFGNEVVFKKMDIYNHDINSSSFDTVCLSNSMHHLRDWKKAYQNLIDLVKPGSNIIINEMISDTDNIQSQNHVLLHSFIAGINSISGIYHRETYERSDIIELLKHKNVECKKIIDYSFPEISGNDIKSVIDIIDNYCKKLGNEKKFEKLIHSANMIKQRILDNGYAHAPSVFFHGIVKK
jgi:ubiquinone/menaquinone biosynthesis C-methylase UbiE